MHPATRTIAFVNALHTLTHYALLILPTAVLGMHGAFGGLDYGVIVALGTAMFAIYGFGSLPVGWLARRYGQARRLAANYICGGRALAACGLAVSPLTFAVALGLAGAFFAIYHPVGTAMLVEAAGERVGRAIGLNGVFGNLGVSLAPLATAVLTAGLGWRVAFIVPGLVCAAIGLLYVLGPQGDGTDSKRPQAVFPDIPRHVAIRAFVVLTLIAVTNGLMFNAVTILLPKLLEERLAGEAGALGLIGLVAFAVSICGAVTQFTVGRAADRGSLRALFLGLAALQLPLMLAVIGARGWATVPLTGLLIASVFGQVTVNAAMLARTVPPALRAKAYAVRFFVGFVGAAAASPLAGLLHARTGDMQAGAAGLAAAGALAALVATAFPHLTTAAAARPAPAE